MPLQGITKEINGRKWTIGVLPVDVAFDVGCRVGEWRGRILAAAGPAAADNDLLGELGSDPEKVRQIVGGQVRAMAGVQETTYRMLRDPEYKREVWTRCLQVTLCEGRQVITNTGGFALSAADIADAVEAHQAVIEHNCPFLTAFGKGQPSAQ